jgi:hypothetical protein
MARSSRGSKGDIKFTVRDFHWNYSSSLIIKRKGFGKDLNKKYAELLYKYSYPYIPKRTSKMANKVRITANDERGMITHLVSYARYQYPNTNYHHKTPTRAKWFEYGFRQHKQTIVSQLNAYRRRHSV